jgi:hypothetical protein
VGEVAIAFTLIQRVIGGAGNGGGRLIRAAATAQRVGLIGGAIGGSDWRAAGIQRHQHAPSSGTELGSAGIGPLGALDAVGKAIVNAIGIE